MALNEVTGAEELTDEKKAKIREEMAGKPDEAIEKRLEIEQKKITSQIQQKNAANVTKIQEVGGLIGRGRHRQRALARRTDAGAEAAGGGAHIAGSARHRADHRLDGALELRGVGVERRDAGLDRLHRLVDGTTRRLTRLDVGDRPKRRLETDEHAALARVFVGHSAQGLDVVGGPEGVLRGAECRSDSANEVARIRHYIESSWRIALLAQPCTMATPVCADAFSSEPKSVMFAIPMPRMRSAACAERLPERQ